MRTQETQSPQILTNQDKRIYIYYLNTTFFPGNHRNNFMVTGKLEHTYVQLHFAGIQECKEFSS